MSDLPHGAIDHSQVFALLPTAVMIMDADLVIVEANAAYLRLLQRERSDIVGRYVFDAFPPAVAGLSPVELSLRRVLATGEADVLPLHQYDIVDAQTGERRRRFWSTVNAPVHGPDGSVQLLLNKNEDVTEFVRLNESRIRAASATDESAVAAELYQRVEELRAAREAEMVAVAALRASEARARAVLDTAVDAIVIFDRAGLVETMNRAAERMFDRSWEATAGITVVDLLLPGQHGVLSTAFRADLVGGDPIPDVGEMTGRRRDGSRFPVELSISDAGPGTGLFTAVIRDISERKQLEAQLAHQSIHDPLTGLANRRQVRPRLEHEVARMNRHPGVLAVLFIDLDGFKPVNDELGHAAGDALLIAVADRLRLGCRGEDLVARFGGDEFVIICADLARPTEAAVIAARLTTLISAPVELAGRWIRPRASIGIVTDDGRRTPDQLLAAADAAMYDVKRERQARR